MTLTPHIVTGAVAARIFTSHPVAAFVLGCATHFMLDAIPHWDYKIDSLSDENTGSDPLNKKVRFNKILFFDVGKVLLDVALGFTLLFWFIFPISNLSILLAGAIGGVLPDFLQFVFGIWKNTPLRLHQKFHHFIHAKKKLDDRPWIGVPIQVGIVGIILFINFLVQ